MTVKELKLWFKSLNIEEKKLYSKEYKVKLEELSKKNESELTLEREFQLYGRRYNEYRDAIICNVCKHWKGYCMCKI